MIGTETTIINEFKRLLDRRLRGYRITLFGSRARGDADEQSDMDLLVVVEEAEDFELLTFVYDCAFEAGLEHGILVNAVVISRDRWENSPERSSLLAQAVRRDGIAV